MFKNGWKIFKKHKTKNKNFKLIKHQSSKSNKYSNHLRQKLKNAKQNNYKRKEKLNKLKEINIIANNLQKNITKTNIKALLLLLILKECTIPETEAEEEITASMTIILDFFQDFQDFSEYDFFNLRGFFRFCQWILSFDLWPWVPRSVWDLCGIWSSSFFPNHLWAWYQDRWK